MHPLITAYIRKRKLERMPSFYLARFHLSEWHALVKFIAELERYGL